MAQKYKRRYIKGKNAHVFLLASKSPFMLSCFKLPSLYKHMQSHRTLQITLHPEE